MLVVVLLTPTERMERGPPSLPAAVEVGAGADALTEGLLDALPPLCTCTGVCIVDMEASVSGCQRGGLRVTDVSATEAAKLTSFIFSSTSSSLSSPSALFESERAGDEG